MKKALQISIAKTLFTIEEDAYAVLDAYLSSVKRHFESSPERDEIVADIEARIAEQLLESKEGVITLPSVERIIAQMGNVSDFEDEEGAKSAAQEGRKKLYRSADDRIVAGVCAGLASYLGFEVLWIRLAFVVGVFLNGIGILIYGVLWLLVPEAKTTSQKLEMTGKPITLETLSETVSERVAELRASGAGNRLGRILTLPFRIIGTIIRFVFGAGLAFGATIAIVAITITSGFLFSGSTLIADEVPLSTLLPGAEHWIFLIGGLCAVIIPLVFILFAGISLLARKNVITSQAGLGLLGVWFISLMISGFGAARMITNYQTFVSTSPEYETVSQSLPLEGDFEALVIERGTSITVVQGTTSVPTLVVEGREKYLDMYTAAVADGILTITRVPLAERMNCVFCGIDHPRLTLTVPALNSVDLKNGSSVRSSDFPASENFAITLAHGSHADITLEVDSLAASLANGSHLSLEGHAEDAEIALSDGSAFRASDFTVDAATVSASRGSYAEVHVLESLDATAQNGSSIRYIGNPTVTEETRGGSVISEY